MKKTSALVTGIVLGGIAGSVFHVTGSSAVAAPAAPAAAPLLAAASASLSPIPTPSCPPMSLAIAFTSNVHNTTTLRLDLPWGKPGDPEGVMIEDYGAFDGVAVREQLHVYDVTTGTLRVLSGHNAIDIILPSGTPLHAVTSGVVYANKNWTIPGQPQGYAAILVSDTLRDDHGEPIAFLYGHVREFDTANGQHVDAGSLIAKSGGDPDDIGAGFSDTANVHFEVIESTNPLTGQAGTVNPHRFLENLYAYAAEAPARCLAGS